MAIPLAVTYEFTLLSLLKRYIRDLEALGLVLTWAWQFQLLEFQNVVNHGGLRGFEPLPRMTKTVAISVAFPYWFQGVRSWCWLVLELSGLNIDKILFFAL